MAEKTGPTRLGRLVVFIFVLGLLAAAVYFVKDLVAPGGRSQGDSDLDVFRSQVGTYEVTLSKRVDGTVTNLTSPQTFQVKPLRELALK